MEQEEVPETVIIDLPTSAPSNWDDFEKLLHHGFYSELRVAPEEHPVLITESSFANPTPREKLVQILFESFNVPCLSIVPTSCLALFGNGISTGLSIHSGETGTEIVPVHDGVPLRSLAVRYPVNGMHLTGFLNILLADKGHTGLTSSWTQVLKDIKKTKCFVSLDPATEPAIDLTYELPDGGVINLNEFSWLCAEAMFYPELISDPSSPLTLTILDVIEQCPADIQDTLLQNIVLSGGNVSFPGFAERLKKDLEYLLNNDDKKVKVWAPQPKESLGNLPWIGGTIYANMPDFVQKCVTVDQYNEIGPTIIQTICK